VFFGEFREPGRGVAERLVGSGRGAVAASHGPHDAGGPPGWECRSVHAKLPGVAGSLWSGTGSNQCGLRPRERGLRAKSSALQGGGGASAVVAGQPGFCQPGGVLAFRGGGGTEPQPGAAGAFFGGSRVPASITGTAAGDAGAAAGEGEPGEYDPGAAQHLFGAGAAARGAGGGADRFGDDRGLVCRCSGAAHAAPARPGQAPHRLPARHRLAGAQARGVRALRVPGGPVSDADLPAGV